MRQTLFLGKSGHLLYRMMILAQMQVMLTISTLELYTRNALAQGQTIQFPLFLKGITETLLSVTIFMIL